MELFQRIMKHLIMMIPSRHGSKRQGYLNFLYETF
jgi:tubulin alpha